MSASSFPGAESWLPDTTDLSDLRDAAASCEGCDLFKAATQTVFGEGPKRASLMLVGEQPGDVEDRQGEPFVGPAGGVLTRVLADAGLAAAPTYVTNAVKHFNHRPEGKRRLHQTPRAAHVTACRPWLRAEVAAVRPALIVALGAVAVRAIFGDEVKVLRDRGTILERDSFVGEATFLVTVHPSSILRAPDDRRAEARAALVSDLTVAARKLADLRRR